jgi:hypothetical protein
MEGIMAEQSSMHFYLNWAKERIDEMDSALASLEAKAGQVQAKVKASPFIADLKKQRDEFQETVKQQAKAGEAAWERTKAQWEPQWNGFQAQVKTYVDTVSKQIDQQAKAGEAVWERTKVQLEPQWNGFEAQMKPYIDTVGKQIEQKKLVFRDVAAAQAKTWRETADKINDAATKFAAGRRADIEAAVKQMRADAEADARLQKLKQAGNESWTVLSAALAESRKAFDRANQTAWDAFKRAAPPNT